MEVEKKGWQKHREILKTAYKKERGEVKKLQELLQERSFGELLTLILSELDVHVELSQSLATEKRLHNFHQEA